MQRRRHLRDWPGGPRRPLSEVRGGKEARGLVGKREDTGTPPEKEPILEAVQSLTFSTPTV
eukprot:scaffold1247_cov251-Pinguiococcus_pyrenoidosus.AAC.12